MVRDSPSPAHTAGARDYSRLAKTAFSRRHTTVTALVVGAGALGNEVLKNLALLGVRTVWIADRDRVEASNLTRSVLYCIPDIDRHIAAGTTKATLAARRVQEINPDVSVRSYVGEIADLGYGVLRRADVVFGCLDNEMARLELGWAGARLGKPVVDGGLGLVNYSAGQVSVFPGYGGPCYACRKGQDRRRELLQELQGREDPCWRKEDAVQAVEGVTTTPLMASVVGALQVELGLRGIQTERADVLGRAYRVALHPTPMLESQIFERSPSCPLHDPASDIRTVLEVPEARSDQWTPADVLRQAGRADGALILDWPITARARCGACSHAWEPLVRRGRFRKQTCPGCGSTDSVETEVLSGIGANSPWASRTLVALGLPRGHVLEVASADEAELGRVHVEMTGDLAAEYTAASC